MLKSLVSSFLEVVAVQEVEATSQLVESTRAIVSSGTVNVLSSESLFSARE